MNMTASCTLWEMISGLALVGYKLDLTFVKHIILSLCLKQRAT